MATKAGRICLEAKLTAIQQSKRIQCKARAKVHRPTRSTSAYFAGNRRSPEQTREMTKTITRRTTSKTTPPRAKNQKPTKGEQPERSRAQKPSRWISRDILEAINEILEDPEPPYGTGVLEVPPISRPPPPRRPPKVGTAIQRSDRTNQRKLAMLATPPPALTACHRRRTTPAPMRSPAKRPRSPPGQDPVPEERTTGETPPAPPHARNPGPDRARAGTSDHGGTRAGTSSADHVFSGTRVPAIQNTDTARTMDLTVQ
ncbi:WAS/WASL-interacting protein family member 1-like [Formica exsecta]|uniref:WAS/WASL-interacting protein family member 1-like n=1 Tax=Formica exsecta TaxID=72781 RepID=UPI0011436C95|nr:WAS/WASL-interacting protein family member 1-like [Formica exsecta]